MVESVKNHQLYKQTKVNPSATPSRENMLETTDGDQGGWVATIQPFSIFVCIANYNYYKIQPFFIYQPGTKISRQIGKSSIFNFLFASQIYTPGSSNIAVAGKWTRIEDVWILLKMRIFQPAMLVYQRVLQISTLHLIYQPGTKISRQIGR